MRNKSTITLVMIILLMIPFSYAFSLSDWVSDFINTFGTGAISDASKCTTQVCKDCVNRAAVCKQKGDGKCYWAYSEYANSACNFRMEYNWVTLCTCPSGGTTPPPTTWLSCSKSGHTTTQKENDVVVGTATDVCTGNYLTTYSCSNNNIISSVTLCPSSCSNGACVSGGTTPPPVTVDCQSPCICDYYQKTGYYKAGDYGCGILTDCYCLTTPPPETCTYSCDGAKIMKNCPSTGNVVVKDCSSESKTCIKEAGDVWSCGTTTIPTTQCTNGEYNCINGYVYKCVNSVWGTNIYTCRISNGWGETGACKYGNDNPQSVSTASDMCEKVGTKSCIGTIPSNAQLCSGDEVGLTQDTQRTIVGNDFTYCTTTKCEYVCNDGYTKSGNGCVKTTPPETCTYSCDGVKIMKNCPSTGKVVAEDCSLKSRTCIKEVGIDAYYCGTTTTPPEKCAELGGECGNAIIAWDKTIYENVGQLDCQPNALGIKQTCYVKIGEPIPPIPPPSECTTNSDCDSGYECQDNSCVKIEEPPKKCVSGGDIFYTNGHIKSKVSVALVFKKSTGEGAIEVTQKQLNQMDDIVPTFSERYYFTKEGTDTCCSGNYDFIETKSVEDNLQIGGIIFGGYKDYTTLTYDIYKCLKEGEEPKTNFCFPWTVSFGKVFSKTASDKDACTYGWVATAILGLTALIVFKRASKP